MCVVELFSIINAIDIPNYGEIIVGGNNKEKGK